MKLLYESTVRDEASQILLRSRLRSITGRKGFTQVEIEKMELVCNEIVTNQIKHARGSGVLQVWEDVGLKHSIDIFGYDYGPGIVNVDLAKEDGVTTTGTLGKGLGAIERLSHKNAIYSQIQDTRHPDRWHGTAVWSRFTPGNPKNTSKVESGVFLRAFQDNFYNGDYVELKNGGSGMRWAHLDGLGHGKMASEAIGPARSILKDELELAERLEKLSENLRFGRGAVGVIGEVDESGENLQIAGVGDMHIYNIVDGERRAITVASGILGHQHRSISVNKVPLTSRTIVITTSDGVKSWTLDSLPYLWRQHPQMIALVMGNVLGRQNDDRSIVVIKKAPENRKQ